MGPITITGIDETIKMLDEAPSHLVASGYVKAMRAAASVIEAELSTREPVREGKMKRARVTIITLDSQLRGVSAVIGYGREGHVANWNEYGHRMVGRRPGKKLLGNVPAHPFMRPAADSGGQRAIEAFAASLAATLKAGI